MCIGCGRCIEACIKSHGGVIEKSARFPIDDATDFLNALGKEEVIALVAPSAQANFNLKKLISALRILGVKAVYDVALGAEIAIYSYHKAIESGTAKLPMIAQPCPAVARYIELNHPALIPHLAPVGSPVHNLAVYIRTLHPQAKLAFISPCLAKRMEFHESKSVEFNVIFQSVDRVLKRRDINIDSLEEGEFDNYVSAGIATNFSTPGGLKESYLFHFPETPPYSISKIEGSLVYEKYLKDLEKDIIQGKKDLPLIVDVLSCEKGCNMGAGCVNLQQSITQIERAVQYRKEINASNSEEIRKLKKFLANIIEELDFSFGPYHDLSAISDIVIPNEFQLEQIYKRMYKEEEKDFRNCLACGYNSCYQMAIAVFNGINKAENCHLYQEKELLREQEILNGMLEELATLNFKLEDEMAERKQQEQLLVQNSKLAAMGEMIGMIAHQWRQPLSSISTLAGNLKVYLDLDMYEKSQFISLLDEINHHSQYLSSTINDFRHFFKPDNPKDKVYLDIVIKNTLGIIGKSLDYKNVQLNMDTSFTQSILTYPNELMQVFLNILKNASDAFTDKKVGNPRININGYEKDGYQVVEISDNAGGIPENILEKIFDPYFSTKGPGIGTGLGLYMSKTIIEEHCEGELSVHNTQEGACFILKLTLC